MSTKINAGTATGGAAISADTTGILELQSGSTPTTAVTIDASQNVGIGTASPAQKLDIAGTTTAGGIVNWKASGGVAGMLYSSSTQAAILDTGTGSNGIGIVPATNYVYLATAGIERMRIDSSGNLLVGTTSVPSGAFSGAGGISATELNLTGGIRSHAGVGGAFNSNRFNFYWTGSAQLWVDSTNIGNISISSDYRIKRNIETQVAPALERVMALRPVTYQMADYGDMFKASDEIREGFIAHEVQEVIPSGAEGHKDEENRIQNLRIDAILAVAVKAIQELKAQLDESNLILTSVKTELDATKAEVAALQTKVGA